MVWDVFRLLFYLFAINVETSNNLFFCFLPVTESYVRYHFSTPRPAQVHPARRCLCLYPSKAVKEEGTSWAGESLGSQMDTWKQRCRAQEMSPKARDKRMGSAFGLASGPAAPWMSSQNSSSP